MRPSTWFVQVNQKYFMTDLLFLGWTLFHVRKRRHSSPDWYFWIIFLTKQYYNRFTCYKVFINLSWVQINSHVHPLAYQYEGLLKSPFGLRPALSSQVSLQIGSLRFCSFYRSSVVVWNSWWKNNFFLVPCGIRTHNHEKENTCIAWSPSSFTPDRPA